MTVFIVFTLVVTAIGVVVYLAMEWPSSTITYIGHPECNDCGVETDELSDYDGDGIGRCVRCTVDYSRRCKHPGVDLSTGAICDRCGAGMQGGMSI